jgi:hypothetical protein
MSIISSATLLGGAPFLAQHGAATVGALHAYLGNVTDKGMLLLLPPMDLILVAFPEDGSVLLLPALQVRWRARTTAAHP